MRLGMMMAALTTVLLAGCGSQGMPVVAVSAPTALAAQGANGAFTQVLSSEWKAYEPVSQALDTWAKAQHLRFKMAPDNREHDVLGAAGGAMATRMLSGGAREIVGIASLSWHRPNSYEWAHTTRAFRLVRQPDGRVTDIRLTGDTLEGVTIVKPRFGPVDAATAKLLMGKVVSFLHEPAQASWIDGDGFLWGAVAGESKTQTFVVEEVTATAGNFGEFGRLIRYKGTLMAGDRPVTGYIHTTMEAVTDRQGRVIDAGDPTH